LKLSVLLLSVALPADWQALSERSALEFVLLALGDDLGAVFLVGSILEETKGMFG